MYNACTVMYRNVNNLCLILFCLAAFIQSCAVSLVLSTYRLGTDCVQNGHTTSVQFLNYGCGAVCDEVDFDASQENYHDIDKLLDSGPVVQPSSVEKQASPEPPKGMFDFVCIWCM